MQLHDIGGSFIHQAATATTSANAAGQPVIFVNLPAWIAPVESTYAVGQEGVKLFPGFAPDDRLVSVNTGRAAELQVVVDDTIRSETPYFFGLHGPNVDWPALAQSDAQVYVAHYSAYDVLLRQAGSFINATITDALPIARFDESITLLAANATLDDAGLTAYLIWQVQDPPEPHVTAFVHVFDEAGQLLAQADGDPISGSYPFFLWVAGTTIQDTRFVDVQGSNLTFRVGLYNRLSGERLAAVRANGEPWADQSVVVPVSEP